MIPPPLTLHHPHPPPPAPAPFLPPRSLPLFPLCATFAFFCVPLGVRFLYSSNSHSFCYNYITHHENQEARLAETSENETAPSFLMHVVHVHLILDRLWPSFSHHQRFLQCYSFLTIPGRNNNNNNDNNVHLSCAHQRPERAHDTY